MKTLALQIICDAESHAGKEVLVTLLEAHVGEGVGISGFGWRYSKEVQHVVGGSQVDAADLFGSGQGPPDPELMDRQRPGWRLECKLCGLNVEMADENESG